MDSYKKTYNKNIKGEITVWKRNTCSIFNEVAAFDLPLLEFQWAS